MEIEGKDKGTWVARQALFSGVQFDSKETYDGNFDKTDMKKYLDTYFIKEIQPSRNVGRALENSVAPAHNFIPVNYPVKNYPVKYNNEEGYFLGPDYKLYKGEDKDAGVIIPDPDYNKISANSHEATKWLSQTQHKAIDVLEKFYEKDNTLPPKQELGSLMFFVQEFAQYNSQAGGKEITIDEIKKDAIAAGVTAERADKLFTPMSLKPTEQQIVNPADAGKDIIKK